MVIGVDHLDVGSPTPRFGALTLNIGVAAVSSGYR